MKRVFLATLGTLLTAMQADAATITLFEYGLNVDGNLTPSGVNLAGFDTSTGLGTIRITVGGVGAHSVLGYFDHEIDELLNTFFNESGSATGVPTAGQSWEIDEPGYVFGDIFTNFKNGALDNANGVPSGSEDDVSMAIGWAFILAAGESGIVDFYVSLTEPGGGFYLKQTDPDSQASIYFRSTLDICTADDDCGQPQVPEPGSLFLLSTGLLGLAAARRRRRAARNTN